MRERGLKFAKGEGVIGECGSLPMRERGLKSPPRVEHRQRLGSLPMRERGLKYFQANTESLESGSLPMRERGLKLVKYPVEPEATPVAPHAGAWIEISRARLLSNALIGRSPCGSVD